MWFNAKWLNRLLAAQSILLDLQAKSADGIRLAPQLHTFESTVSLNEASLDEVDETASSEVESDEDGEFFLHEDPQTERTDE
jgi:hypothetical protein